MESLHDFGTHVGREFRIAAKFVPRECACGEAGDDISGSDILGIVKMPGDMLVGREEDEGLGALLGCHDDILAPVNSRPITNLFTYSQRGRRTHFTLKAHTLQHPLRLGSSTGDTRTLQSRSAAGAARAPPACRPGAFAFSEIKSKGCRFDRAPPHPRRAPPERPGPRCARGTARGGPMDPPIVIHEPDADGGRRVHVDFTILGRTARWTCGSFCAGPAYPIGTESMSRIRGCSGGRAAAQKCGRAKNSARTEAPGPRSRIRRARPQHWTGRTGSRSGVAGRRGPGAALRGA